MHARRARRLVVCLALCVLCGVLALPAHAAGQAQPPPSTQPPRAPAGDLVRVFLDCNVAGSVSRVRDQLYLPKGEATTEEVLLRQRELATSYQYFVMIGFSYSFGSIFNNASIPASRDRARGTTTTNGSQPRRHFRSWWACRTTSAGFALRQAVS
jgi:hypothetical protein